MLKYISRPYIFYATISKYFRHSDSPFTIKVHAGAEYLLDKYYILEEQAIPFIKSSEDIRGHRIPTIMTYMLPLYWEGLVVNS